MFNECGCEGQEKERSFIVRYLVNIFRITSGIAALIALVFLIDTVIFKILDFLNYAVRGYLPIIIIVAYLGFLAWWTKKEE